MTITDEINLLKEEFNLQIPDDFIFFMNNKERKKNYNLPITIEGEQYILSSFITTSNDFVGSDLYKRYLMCSDETEEYLAFACGFDNDEFSIKVKGENSSSIYHIITLSDEPPLIRKISNSIQQFEFLYLKNN